MKKRILALLLLAAFVLSACSSATPSQPAPKPATPANPKILRQFETADATTLNPHQALASLEDTALSYIMGGLYRTVIEGSGEKQIPELAAAEPKKMDALGKVWRIQISPKAVWENGEKMNADTFMYSWKMQLDPKLLNPTANTFYQYFIEIVNAQAYFEQGKPGKAPVKWEDVGIKKIDDMTIEITTTQRYNASEVMRHMQSKSAKPVYQPWYEKYMNETKTATTYGTDKSKTMSCGPFVLDSWVKGSERVYKKNPLSPIANLIKLDGVKFSVVKDSGTAMQLFLAGNLDIIDLTGDQVDQYQEDPRTRVYPSRVVTHMDINAGNTANPILKNMNFRRAMYWAMDRNTFAKLTKQMAAPTYIHHTAGGYPDDNILYRDLPEAKALVNPNGGYDPVKAKNYFNAALAETGIKGKVTVNLMYSDASAETKIIGEYMQKQLPIIFGADKFALTLTSSPSASFSATKRNWVNNPNAYQMAFGSWSNSSTLIYPNTQFRYFASSYSSGSAPYNNAKFDQLFNQSLTEEYRLDQKKTVAATIEMEKIFLNEVLAVPVYEAVSRTMFAPRVKLPLKDYVPSVGWGYMYSDIDLTK